MIFRLMISQYSHDKLLGHCSLIRCTVRSLYSTPYSISHPTSSLYIYTSHIQWFSRHLCACTSLQVQIDIVTCLSSVPYNNNSLVREQPLSTILIFRFTAHSLVRKLALSGFSSVRLVVSSNCLSRLCLPSVRLRLRFWTIWICISSSYIYIIIPK